MTLEEIKDELRKMDPDFDPDSDTGRAQIVLISALEVGPNQRKIAKFTGLSLPIVAKFAHNLKKNGVWKNGKVYADWFEENGGISFNLDTCVALGWLDRTGA